MEVRITVSVGTQKRELLFEIPEGDATALQSWMVGSRILAAVDEMAEERDNPTPEHDVPRIAIPGSPPIWDVPPIEPGPAPTITDDEPPDVSTLAKRLFDESGIEVKFHSPGLDVDGLGSDEIKSKSRGSGLDSGGLDLD